MASQKSKKQKQEESIPMIVDGLSLEEIAQKLDIENVSTIEKWLKTDVEYVAAIESREEIVNNQRERAARRELENQIADPDTPKTAKLNASRALLAYRTATERERDTGVKVNFANLPMPKSGKRGDDE